MPVALPICLSVFLSLLLCLSVSPSCLIHYFLHIVITLEARNPVAERSLPPPQLSEEHSTISARNESPLLSLLQPQPINGRHEGEATCHIHREGGTTLAGGVTQQRRRWRCWPGFAGNSAVTSGQWKPNNGAVSLQWTRSFAGHQFTQPGWKRGIRTISDSRRRLRVTRPGQPSLSR